MWEIKQSSEPNTIELYIYGDVKGDDYNWWRNEVMHSETSAEHFRDELAQYPTATEIKLYINSYGGSVFEGTAIYNQLRRHTAHKTVYVDGFACSVAATIAMAGDTVVMPRNAMMMIHNAWMDVCGNSHELRKAADDLEQINKGNRQAYLSKANGKISEGELVEKLDAETWLTAEDCIKYGFADEYSENDADMSGAANVLQQANLNVQQRIQVQVSLAAQLRQLTESVDEALSGGKPPAEPTPQPETPAQKTFFNFRKGVNNEIT